MLNIKRPTIRQHARMGFKRDHVDPRDRHFAVGNPSLPVTFDTRQYSPPLLNQGQTSSCVAHGVTAAVRTVLLRDGKPDRALSRLQLYYDTRVLEGTINSDCGCEIRDAIKNVATVGVADEVYWPFDESKVLEQPTHATYTSAHKFKALSFERVAVGVIPVKAALVKYGVPVIVGINLYPAFESDAVAATGMVPMPGDEVSIGGHCMRVVGYGQRPGHFTVRNQWGSEWGDGGDCYIPEQYIGSESFGMDYWCIKSVQE